jgi:hypothetical protein
VFLVHAKMRCATLSPGSDDAFAQSYTCPNAIPHEIPKDILAQRDLWSFTF